MFSLSATLKNGHLLTLDGDVTVEQVQGILPQSSQIEFNPTPCRAIQLDHNENDQHYYIHRQLSEFPDFEEYRILTTMDKKSKKSESASVPMPRFLVNNPNISILPATNINIQSPSTPPKQLPISTVHRVSKVITPVSLPPVSYNRINNQVKSTVKNSFESVGVRANCKRNAFKSNCDRPKKMSRLSIATTPKSHIEKTDLSKSPDIPKLKHIKDDPVKKNDSSSVPTNLITVTSTPSTSNAANRVTQDSPSQQPTKQLPSQQLMKQSLNQQPIKQSPTQQLSKQSPSQQSTKQSPSQQSTKQSPSQQLSKPSPSQQASKQSPRQHSITDLNSKADCLSTSSTDVEENQNVVLKEYQFLLGDFKSFNKPIIDARKTVKLVYDDESFEIERPMIGNQLLLKLKELMHEHLPTSELEFVKQNNSKIMNSSENKWLPESNEDISSSNYKYSVNHNNISTSKHQSTSHGNMKSQRTTSYQAPSTSKQPQSNTQISPSNSTSIKQSTSSNSTSKITQPLKQQDLKHHNVSTNIHSTSLKHSMATVTHNSSVNKQIICDQHQPTSTKNAMVSVTQMSSVSVQAIPVKPTIPCQPIHDVKKCSKCKEISEDDVCTTCRMSSQLKGVTVTRIEKPITQSNVNEALSTTVDLISDDEESTEDIKRIQEEPVVTRIESDEIIMKHIEKLNSSPTFLDESSWPKDTCSLPSCRTINIGSFSTLPVSSDGVLFSLNGIRLNVNNVDMQPVYIDVHIDNIVKILAYYGEPNPAIFIYTDYLAAVGIQHLLKMKETNKTCYFDPISKDDSQRKIVLYYDSSTYVTRPLETVLLKLPKGKYAPLTNREFKIMMSHTEEPKRTPILKEDDIVIISEVDNRTVSPVKIFDYKMLRVDEFVNDVLIEFYLNYWYSRGLSEEDQKRSYVFSTFFYTSLTSKKKHNTRHDRVKSWTKNVNIFEKDFIFVPINESFHWYMAVICFPYLMGPVLMENEITSVNSSGEDTIPNPCKPEPPEKKFYCDINPDRDEVDGNMEDLRYFHPNYNDRNGEDYETDIKNLTVGNSRPQIKQPCILLFDSLCGYENRARVIATLRDWLVEEYRAKNNGAQRDFSRAVFKGHVVKVPQQPNSSDCGLFVMHYFEKFFQHPIMDYTLPILHLENWFHIDEVTKDCQKRRDVQNAIKTVMREQKAALPVGVELPEIIFRKDSSENSQNSSHYGSHNNHHFYDNDSDDIEHVEDESEDLDSEVDEEEYFEEDEDPEEYNMEGRYNQYPDGYGDEYPELEEDPDPREFYGEMAEHEDWNENQHDNDGEYHSESEYGAEEMNHYHHMQLDVDNVVVDVDGHEASSSNHRNRHLNDSLRSFTNKSLVFRNNDENDGHEDEDDDNEEEDDDDNSNNHNRSKNHHSAKHTRFHHHR